MVWARIAIAGGLLMVMVAFSVGVEHRLASPDPSVAADCGRAIPAAMLMSGSVAPDTARRDGATGGDQRAAATCAPAVREAQVLVGASIVLGALLVVAGWTALGSEVRPITRRASAVA